MGRKPVLTRMPTQVQADAGTPAEPEPPDWSRDEGEWMGDEAEEYPEDDEGWASEGPAMEGDWAGAEPEPEGDWAEAEPAEDEELPMAEPADEAEEADEAADEDAESSPSARFDIDTGDGGDTKADELPAETGVQHSLDTLINTIPGEILVLWAALEGAAELYELPLWAYGLFLILVAIATPVYVYRSIDRPPGESTGSTDSTVEWWQEANVRWQSVSATGAFLVWVYYLGGPFQAAGLQDAALATVLVIIYPILIVISPYYGSLLLYQVSSPSPDGNRGEAVR